MQKPEKEKAAAIQAHSAEGGRQCPNSYWAPPRLAQGQAQGPHPGVQMGRLLRSDPAV